MAVEFPDLLGLACRAEDRCRAEHFPRLRRKVERLHAMGWTREVRHLALPLLAQSAHGLRHASAVSVAAAGLADLTGGTRSFARVRESEAEIRKRKRSEHTDAPPSSRGGGGGGSGSGSRPEKAAKGSRPPAAKKHTFQRNGRFFTTHEGKEVRFRYKKGACEATCSAQRVHLCQACLGAHPITRRGDTQRGFGRTRSFSECCKACVVEIGPCRNACCQTSLRIVLDDMFIITLGPSRLGLVHHGLVVSEVATEYFDACGKFECLLTFHKSLWPRAISLIKENGKQPVKQRDTSCLTLGAVVVDGSESPIAFKPHTQARRRLIVLGHLSGATRHIGIIRFASRWGWEGRL